MFDRLFDNDAESQRFFDKLSDAIIIIDRFGIIHSYNQAAQALFGYTVDEVIGKNVSMLMPKSERPAHDGYLSNRNAGATDHVVGKIRSIEALKKDGTAFPAHIAISEFDTQDGSRFVGFVHDLTVIVRQQQQIELENERLRIQHKVESAVQKSKTPEALLRTTLKTLVGMSELELQSKAGVFLIDGQSSSGSRSLSEPTAIPGDPQGLRLAMLEGAFTDEFIEHENWIPYGACLCGRVAQSGSVIMSTDCFADCRHEHRFTGMQAHGHYIIPLAGADGVLGVIFLYTDVEPQWGPSMENLMSTIGVMVGTALERLWGEQKNASLLNTLNLALIGSHSTLVKIDFDSKKMIPVSGYKTSPNLQITSLSERMRCIPAEYHEAVHFARASSDKVVVPFDLISRRYWLEFQYVHEVYEQNRRVQYCLVRDITKEKEVQDARDELLTEVSEHRRQQERLYGIIGHEMKTPASALSMLIDSGPINKLFLDMRLAMDNLLAVMGDMRMLSNPQSQIELVSKPFLPQRLIHQVKEQLDALYRSQNIDLSLKSDLPETLEVLGDAPRINMLLSNLLRNAALHSEGRQVKLSQRLLNEQSNEDEVLIQWTVEDDGKGIPGADLERLLKPFERGNSKSEGTGLGLYIINMICEALGAKLSYQTSPMGGASFSLTASLPISHSGVQTDITYKDLEQFDGQGRRVLVVEDNLTIRMLSKKILTDLNFVVTTAENGAQGLNALGSTSFDLILTDYYMPVMNGDELISAIRAKAIDTPIIGVSASEADEEYTTMLAVGADGVIGKPLTKAKLIEVLNSI